MPQLRVMASPTVIVTALFVAVFSAVHLNVHRLVFLDVKPRSAWLSFSGGVAVAYIFLHVLPDLGTHQKTFAQELQLSSTLAESLVYALTLIGLVCFYGLERMVKISRSRSRAKGQGDRIEDHLEWVHAGSYAVLNLLVGYLLLHREETGPWSLGLYFVAMALHFLTSDYGMRIDHPEAYEKRGRWVLAASVVIGWALGLAVSLPLVAVGFLFAFLAGGIILNTLKEELPEDRSSRFLPFLGGALVYSLIMLGERTMSQA